MTTKKATRPITPGDGVTLASPSVFEDRPVFVEAENVISPSVVYPPAVVLTPADRRKALRGAAASFIRARNRG